MKFVHPLLCVLLTSATILGFSPAASGETRRVPQDYSTIQEAIDASRPGDRIAVGKGRFNERLWIGNRRDLAIIGTRRTRLTADVEIERSRDITLRGITFEGAIPTLANRIMILDSRDIRIERCSFADSDTGVLAQNVRNLEIAQSAFLGMPTAIWAEGCDAVGLADCVLRGSQVLHTTVFIRDCVDAWVSCCKIRDAALITFTCAAVAIEESALRRTTIVLNECVGSGIARNRILKPGPNNGYAVTLWRSSQCVIESNRITTIGGQGGIVIDGGGNLIQSNVLIRAGDNGLMIQDTGNRIYSNTVLDSVEWDLFDSTGGADNEYRDNECGTSNI